VLPHLLERRLAAAIAAGAGMDIHTVTREYEAWVAAQTPLIAGATEHKHKRMAEAPFLLFGGTFYRWTQLWPKICPALATVSKTITYWKAWRR
jgi:hypothetical protein